LKDPQVSIFLAYWLAVTHLSTNDSRPVVDRDNLGGESKNLVWPFSVLFPHSTDGVDAHNGLFVWRVQIGGIGGEQRRDLSRACGAPRMLVPLHPTVYSGSIGHRDHLDMGL
jgi:hypothetical protein